MVEETKYVVHMLKQTKSSPDRFFVVTKISGDEFSYSSVLHSKGFWSSVHPKESINLDNNIVEVWIPWIRIDYVESLLYKSK